MSSLAEIFRRYGADYLMRYSNSMLPGHRQAMRDILLCRTEQLGGHTFYCEDCQTYHSSYHSCRNRHCPQCQNEKAELWLAQQMDKLLPVEYFMATFTLPEALRHTARSYQKEVYHLFFQASAESLQTLADDPRFLGGELGMVGVLQTWSRTLIFHPHIHYLIPGIGISGELLRFAQEGFLMHTTPLSQIFRAKFRDALKRCGLYEEVSETVWQQEWVVHIQSVGKGQAALKYLATYLYRVAISNNNILSCENGEVCFRYKDSHSNASKIMTLPAAEFIRRFLQHVLPKGFQKVRHYGFLATQKRNLLDLIRLLLYARGTPQKTATPQEYVYNCPNCGKPMSLIKRGSRKRAPPLAEILQGKSVQQSLFNQS